MTPADRRIAGEHVHDEDGEVAVPVDIGHVEPHRRAAPVTHRVGGDGAEGAPARVDPEAVGRAVVVGDDEVRCPVAVEVAELDAGPPVARRVHGTPVGVEEGAGFLADRREASSALVAVEPVGLGHLHHLALRADPETSQPPRMRGRQSVDLRDPGPAALPGDHHLHRRVGQRDQVAVVGAVQVEIAVAVDVRQRHRHRGRRAGQAGVGPLREPSTAVVAAEPGAGGDPVGQQVHIPVAIHVGQDGPGRQLVRAGGRTDRPLLETQVTTVQEQPVGSLEGAQVDVGSAIPIHIPDGHSRPVVGHGIGEEGIPLEAVGEGDARAQPVQPGEAHGGLRPRRRGGGPGLGHETGDDRAGGGGGSDGGHLRPEEEDREGDQETRPCGQPPNRARDRPPDPSTHPAEARRHRKPEETLLTLPATRCGVRRGDQARDQPGEARPATVRPGRTGRRPGATGSPGRRKGPVRLSGTRAT